MIERVFAADGRLLHDCQAAGCAASWDGYVRAEALVIVATPAQQSAGMADGTFPQGARIPGAVDPDARWDLSRPGEAHRRPDV